MHFSADDGDRYYVDSAPPFCLDTIRSPMYLLGRRETFMGHIVDGFVHSWVNRTLFYLLLQEYLLVDVAI
jgi:hypothetical protein